MKKILQVISKNTSTLDFMMPIFLEIKKNHNNFIIEILILKFSPSEIIKNNSYYYKFLKENKIRVYSLTDVIKDYSGKFTFVQHLFIFILRNKIIFISRFLNKIIEKNLSYEKFFNSRNYDLLILDNRSGLSREFFGYKKFYQVLESIKIKHLVIPHAPHFADKNFIFENIGPNNFRANENTYVWYPFQYTNVTEDDRNLCASIDFIGYPGFDSKWIEANSSDIENQSVLYLGRKQALLPQSGGEFVTIGLLEQIREFNDVSKFIKKLGIKKYKFIYKIHPSGNKNLARLLLFFSHIKNWTISDECIYSFTNKVKYVISPYSTIVLFFFLTDSSTFIFDNRILKSVKSKWDILNEFYSKLTFNFDEIKDNKEDNFRNRYCKTVIREYFPDYAVKNALNSLIRILYSL